MPYLAFASAAHCFSCGVRAGAAPDVVLAERLPLPTEPLPEDCDVAVVDVGAGPTRDAGDPVTDRGQRLGRGASQRIPGGPGRVSLGREGLQHATPRASWGTVVDHVHGHLSLGQRRRGRRGGRFRRGRGPALGGGAALGGTGRLGYACLRRGRECSLHDPLDRGDVDRGHCPGAVGGGLVPGSGQRREL